MSTIRPLATIAVLAVLGFFLAAKINEGPSVALESEWASEAPGFESAEAAPAWPVEAAPAQAIAPESADPSGFPTLPELPEAPTAATPPAVAEKNDQPIELPASIPQANYGASSQQDRPAISGRVPSLGSSTSDLAAAGTNNNENRYGSAPVITEAPDPAAEFETAWPLIQNALARNELTRAHLLLSQWRDTPGLSPARRSEVEALLSDLAGTVVYSMEHRLEPPHQVQPGETLGTIAEEYRVPWELLAKINGVASPEAVQPGQILKVVRGPFSADVDLQRGEVILLLDDRYAGRFDVNPLKTIPATGQWQVDQKKLDPLPSGRYASSSPNYQRKVMLRSNSGELVELSSATAPSIGASGHLSIASADLDELYDILSVGSAVTIRR